MVHRGQCDPFVDILLIGWWWGFWESASSTFWFQQVWGLHTCGQYAVNFFYLVGFPYLQNSSKLLLHVCLEGDQDPAPRPHYCFLIVSLSPSWLAAVWTGHYHSGSSGGKWNLFPIIKKPGTQKDFCAQEPHRLLLGFTPTSWVTSYRLFN